MINPMSIDFLYSPDSFYRTLIELIRSAKERVYVSTLYMGNSKMEQKLLETLSTKQNVHILIDGLRGNRKEGNNESSIEVIRRICPHAKIDEFITPLYRGFFKLLPNRLNEIVGTQHMKLVVVDDHVIITGANLSDIYFTNRQDRYVVIRNEKHLADTLVNVIRTRGEVSSNWEQSSSSSNTNISISCQRGYLNSMVGQTDSVTRLLLQDALQEGYKDTLVTLASPYLNIAPDILDILVHIPKVHIITNSKETNAFFGSKGLSRFIPEAYAIVEDDLLQAVDSKKISVFEYSRPGWSFHPKGIWVERNSVIDDTIIGSSNFGLRSKFRDLELSFRIKSSHAHIQHQLKTELNGIMKYSKLVSSCRPARSMWLKFLTKGPLKTFL